MDTPRDEEARPRWGVCIQIGHNYAPHDETDHCLSFTPMVEQLFVPLTDEWWEPSGDPDQYRLVEGCGDDCHHPVHGFGVPRPAHHLEEAKWIKANASESRYRPAAPSEGGE